MMAINQLKYESTSLHKEEKPKARKTWVFYWHFNLVQIYFKSSWILLIHAFVSQQIVFFLL